MPQVYPGLQPPPPTSEVHLLVLFPKCLHQLGWAGLKPGIPAGSPTWARGPTHLGHPLLLSQVPQQGAGLRAAPRCDASIPAGLRPQCLELSCPSLHALPPSPTWATGCFAGCRSSVMPYTDPATASRCSSGTCQAVSRLPLGPPRQTALSSSLQGCESHLPVSGTDHPRLRPQRCSALAPALLHSQSGGQEARGPALWRRLSRHLCWHPIRHWFRSWLPLFQSSSLGMA